MNHWKTLSLTLATLLAIILTTLIAKTLNNGQHHPNNTDIENYITATQQWIHAEEQLKLAIGAGLKTINAHPHHTPARSELHALLTLDPPQVPDIVAALTANSNFNGDYTPLKQHIRALNVDELQAHTQQLINASKTAEERTRAISRRITRLEQTPHPHSQ